LEFSYLFALSLFGITLIAWGCEGYVVKLGKINLWARPLLIISGLLIGFPEMKTTIIGVILAFMLIAVMGIRKKLTQAKE
jgi:TRAP-type uncharacterized transport system fused permease subunit